MTFPLQIAPDRWRPLRRVEYERLIEDGVFADEKVELIRGLLIRMSPQKAPHSSTTRKLFGLLHEKLKGRAVVYSQAPIALSDDSEPEPDVFVAPLASYDRELPTSALLVVEVADSTLRYDRHDKTALYASCGVPECWLVDLLAESVEVYREPSAQRVAGVADAGYHRLTTFHRGESIAPEAFPDALIALDDILPSRP